MGYYYVDKSLKVRGSMPPAGYQFRGSKEECEEYVDDASKTYTKQQQTQNEIDWLKSKGGDSLVKSCFGKDWENKRKEHDANWDKIRRSRNKRKKL